MMSVGMHCRLLGRPGRFRALQRFLDYISSDKVWVCTRQQIADHWREVIRIAGLPAAFSALSRERASRSRLLHR
ncbi:hypothetical protein [Klebsiella pneumoniae]|uniref:hypothetical protein n=1 Tax=Klebsiella pneumoniae TaxID=573 RepID=UPI00138FE48E|nr:hypothetical protein [Klebsiella pneumoniae]